MSKRFKGWLAGVCWDIGDFFFGLWTRWEKYDEGEWISVEIANPRMEALEAEHEAVEVYVLTVCREMYGGDLPCGICAKEAPKRWRLCQAHQAVGEVE